MSYFKNLALIAMITVLLFPACTKEGAIGATIASQVTGTFMSTQATVIVDDETLINDSPDYAIRITEVDANTVSVITDHTSAFEVDLSKSDDGTITTGKVKSGGSNFIFLYSVGDGGITINYNKNNVALSFEGVKE